MKYWVPDLYLATQLPLQSNIEDKFGGLPWGLPPHQWPLCRLCGTPLSFIAQFANDDERMDLGATGRVLFIFECNSPRGCPSWEGGSGANDCFVLDPGELTKGATPPPRGNLPIETEARVFGMA